jgi:hypothetical protein
MGAYGVRNDVTLPKDTILKVDRIYIRQGSEDFDSVTFRISDCPNKDLIKKRFWVKLDDANKLEFEPVVFNKKIKMQWRGWIRNIRTNITLINSFDVNYDFGANSMELKIDDFTRFEIKLIIEKLEPTEENWLKAGLDKIYMGYSKLNPGGTYSTLSEYLKYSNRYMVLNKFKLDDYIIMIVSYKLIDFKTGIEYTFKTVNSCKEKARSIIKAENKNG